MSTTSPPDIEPQHTRQAEKLAARLLRRGRLRPNPGVSRGRVAAALARALAALTAVLVLVAWLLVHRHGLVHLQSKGAALQRQDCDRAAAQGPANALLLGAMCSRSPSGSSFLCWLVLPCPRSEGGSNVEAVCAQHLWRTCYDACYAL